MSVIIKECKFINKKNGQCNSLDEKAPKYCPILDRIGHCEFCEAIVVDVTKLKNT